MSSWSFECGRGVKLRSSGFGEDVRRDVEELVLWSASLGCESHWRVEDCVPMRRDSYGGGWWREQAMKRGR